jgi:hypothetical protein
MGSWATLTDRPSNGNAFIFVAFAAICDAVLTSQPCSISSGRVVAALLAT